MEESSQLIDKYEIGETVLKSAEGILYRAVDTATSTRVWLKKYYPTLVWSDEVLNDFFNLFSYLRFIEHESLLPILDVGKHNGQPYIVFMDNGSIMFSNRQPGAHDEQEMLEFLSVIAEVLDFLHKQEVIHGGLGIQNIAIDADGFPLLFDFGLNGVFKKLLLENMDDGFENLSVTDLRCTSPEQVLGRSPTRASDIYSFGVIGFFYLFGKLPFDGKYVPEIATSLLTSAVMQNIRLPEGVSKDVLPLIEKCMQVDPRARFASASQLLNSLESLKAGSHLRLKFQHRFAVAKPPVRISPAYMGLTVFVLVAVLSTYAYLQNKDATAQAQATATAQALAALSLTKTSTPTQILTEATPTQVATIPLTATQTAATFQLAFENQKPFIPREPISTENLSKLQEISRLGYGKPEEADVAPDNNHVAVATSAGVALFNGDQFLKWIDVQGWATSVQFSLDGRHLAIGLATGEIQIWDWQNSVISSTLAGYHTDRINRILFASNGLLYSASSDRNIGVWNPMKGDLVRPISAHSRAVNDIAVTSDSLILISCSDDGLIRWWDVTSSDKMFEMDSTYFTGTIKAIALSSDDVYLAAGSDAGYLYQWGFLEALSTANPLPRPRNNIVPVQERIWSVEYIRENQELLVGVDNGKSVTYDATRKDFPGRSYSFEIASLPLDLVDVFGPRFPFDSFSVFRNGSVISLNWNGQVTLQENELISPMYDILDHMDFSPDGTVLAAGGKRGSTHVWNLINNQVLYKNLYFMPFGDPISPDGKVIAILVPRTITTDSGNTLHVDHYQLINLSGNQLTRDLTQAPPGAHVGYALNGSLFIAANLKESKAWDFGNGNETRLAGYAYTGCWVTASTSSAAKLHVNSAAGLVPVGNDERIDSLCPKSYASRNGVPAISKDISLLVYIDSNGSLAGFNVMEKSPAWQPYSLKGLSKATVLAVSPDGALILVGHESGTISFFDGTSGELIGSTTGNFGAVRAALFSEDGTRFATAGDDGLVRVFGIVTIPEQ